MPLTRFAPAPTGLLHLGHVVNALHVWGIARRVGADVLLRIEDHDRQRSRREFEVQALDDLDWLGFRPSLYPTAVFRAGPCASRQSDRHTHYGAAARLLSERGLVYGCACSRATMTGRVYPGTCRDRNIALTEAPSWRLRLETAPISFNDLLVGAVTQDPAALSGDPVIRDRRGNWTYQFAVAVDDLDQQIDLVIRGRDLLPSTALQVAIARVLGRPTPPRYAHHMLLMKSPTQKLSKSDGDSGIVELRRAGWSAPKVLGHAAALAGLATEGTLLDASDAGRLFASRDLHL